MCSWALKECNVTTQTRMSRPLDKGERARIGVSQLRRFLEQLLQRRCFFTPLGILTFPVPFPWPFFWRVPAGMPSLPGPRQQAAA